jgi:uncharacterized protein YciI
MLFAILCTDKPDGAALRARVRDRHLAYLKTLADRVKIAGRTTTPDGGAPTGSLLIVEADDLEHARALAAGDPYAEAGLFTDVEIRGWSYGIGSGMPPASP